LLLAAAGIAGRGIQSWMRRTVELKKRPPRSAVGAIGTGSFPLDQVLQRALRALPGEAGIGERLRAVRICFVFVFVFGWRWRQISITHTLGFFRAFFHAYSWGAELAGNAACRAH
jgi:hypothetical protein